MKSGLARFIHSVCTLTNERNNENKIILIFSAMVAIQEITSVVALTNVAVDDKE